MWEGKLISSLISLRTMKGEVWEVDELIKASGSQFIAKAYAWRF